MHEITPYWSGVVTPEVIETLTYAIEKQFVGKLFTTLFDSEHNDPHFPRTRERGGRCERHRRIDEIKSYHDARPPFIWLIVRNNWCIHVGEFVCLTERMLLVERIYCNNAYETWCWILEE